MRFYNILCSISIFGSAALAFGNTVSPEGGIGGAGAVAADEVRGLVAPGASPPTQGRAREEAAARFPFNGQDIMVGLRAAVTPTTDARPHGAVFAAATGRVPSLLESPPPSLGPVATEAAALFRHPTRYKRNNLLVRFNHHQETDILIQPDFIRDHKDGLLHIDALANRKLESINPIFQGELVPTDGAANDQFGRSVGIYGHKVIVGATHDDDTGCNSGSAYIYAHNGTTWVEEAKLVPDDGAAWDRFGNAVAMYGNRVIVGAHWDDGKGTGSGSAYIYVYNGTSWVQEAKLVPADGAAYDEFGFSVAMYGNKVIVGAVLDYDKGSNSGSAYIYVYNGTSWMQEAKLVPANGTTGDEFGRRVGIYADKVVVGAFRDDENGENSGSAYIYAHNGTSWVQEAKLVPTDVEAGNSFGVDVAIYGNKVIVGANQDDDNGTDSGSAYLYAHNGTSWAQEAKLVPADGEAGNFFGIAVAMYGNKVVVGADQDDSGSAYIYAHDGSDWVQEAKVGLTDGEGGDLFGCSSVSIYGDNFIVGSPRTNAWSGSAFIWGGLESPAPTSPPSTAPSNSPTFSPIKAPWEIEHTATESNFNSSNWTGAVTMKFLIGKERNHTESAFAGECDPVEEEGTAIDPGVMTTHVVVEDSDDPTMDELTVEYEFDMGLVAGSNAYDDNTDTIKFCQRVELVQYLDDGSDFVIAQQLTNVAIAFNLTAGFTIDIDLNEAEVNQANDTANLDSFISAIHCDGSKEMNELPVGTKIKPNDDLDICVLSSSSDVEIEEIASMTIQGKKPDGTDSSLAVVADGRPSIPAITYFNYQTATGVAVRTRVPTNAFDFEAENAAISVVGSVALKFKGGRRRLANGAGSATRDLQAAAADEGVASFDLSVSIEPEESSVGDGFVVTASSAKNAPGHKSLPVLAALLASALAVVW